MAFEKVKSGSRNGNSFYLVIDPQGARLSGSLREAINGHDYVEIFIDQDERRVGLKPSKNGGDYLLTKQSKIGHQWRICCRALPRAFGETDRILVNHDAKSGMYVTDVIE